jgi:hypothetical protein
MDAISAAQGVSEASTSAQIGVAVIAKQLSAQRQEGQNVLSLIDSAGMPLAQATRAAGMTGAIINVAA